MTPAERREVIRELSRTFTSLTEDEADVLLATAGGRYTRNGWGQQSDQIKRVTIKQHLIGQSDAVLEKLMELLDVEDSLSAEEPNLDPPPKADQEPPADGPIFVVHGHDRAALHESVRVLERGTDREVIVLREQANAGRTILEKFEGYAAQASFAVVLLTADDEGGIRSSSDPRPRGRQNVIFELGFFFGKLGRDRVVVLHEENVEKPSDISGLAYISLDQAGAWKQALARELEAAGISVNRARIP